MVSISEGKTLVGALAVRRLRQVGRTSAGGFASRCVLGKGRPLSYQSDWNKFSNPGLM